MFIPLLLLAFTQDVQAYAAQVPLRTVPPRLALHGRFLHITDLHPDPHYRNNASVSSSCHRNNPKDEEERAGYWGTAWSECDAPERFVNYTLDYLEKNWADNVDFVIWTGDNARHDEDPGTPRTTAEIYESNRHVAAKMEEIFTRRGIPVVPSIGNNDIWPHNIMQPGPTEITNEYVNIWQSFIPFASYQVFQRGAYYSTELIPNQIAAISLNTLYFYDSNKAVGGCTYKDTNDPGNLQLDWLDVQLSIIRGQGMQAYLTGHVPPSIGNFFPECYRRYVELSLRYQDTILGHLYGHMNLDHFFFVDSEDLLREPDSAGVMKKYKLHKSLKKDFANLPKTSKIDHDEYAIVNAAPALVANPYLPSFRVFSYNVTGYNDGSSIEAEQTRKKKKGSKRKHGHRHGGKTKDCKKKENRDHWVCRPQKPWHSSPDSPSRSNTLWTPLGYAQASADGVFLAGMGANRKQYYCPDLETSNKTNSPTWELEYLTYRVSALHPPAANVTGVFNYPIPPRLLPLELRNVTGTVKSELAPYGMTDLTIPSWLGLAQRLVKDKKLWKLFKKYMYLGA